MQTFDQINNLPEIYKTRLAFDNPSTSSEVTQFQSRDLE